MEFESREAFDRYYRTVQQIEALRTRPMLSLRSVAMRGISHFAIGRALIAASAIRTA